MRLLKQSTGTNIMVFMTQSSDHITGLTGATLTITASKDGAAFGSISPTVTERGSGWYNLALTSSHTDTLGDLAIHVTATSADPTDLLCRIVAGALDADVSGVPALVWATNLEGSLDGMEILRILLSVNAGITDITGSTVTFRDLADTKNRVTATVSGSERTAVTLDGT